MHNDASPSGKGSVNVTVNVSAPSSNDTSPLTTERRHHGNRMQSTINIDYDANACNKQHLMSLTHLCCSEFNIININLNAVHHNCISGFFDLKRLSTTSIARQDNETGKDITIILLTMTNG